MKNSWHRDRHIGKAQYLVDDDDNDDDDDGDGGDGGNRATSPVGEPEYSKASPEPHS